jgi:UDP-N-acetylglucosamine kinase
MDTTSEEAYRYAKKNKKLIISKFLGDKLESNEKPIFIFMAGAPGAGKTEFSKTLIGILKKSGRVKDIARIDADEIREIFKPMGYDGKNSDEYKRGCVKGIETLFDYCLKNKYHTVIDGTFASINVAERNIEAALSVKAVVFIVYVYQDPLVAWGFAKIREKDEGRKIEKELFTNALFKSLSNVNTIKRKYNEKVEVWLVEKDITNTAVKNIRFNIDNIDNYLKIAYNPETLNNILYEETKR